MNYVKKMCILRQIKQGFSGDGKTLSGLIKIEQYGKNLAVEVSIINFAPLVSGEYYCLLSDGRGKTEMLSLRGKSMFNLLSDLDISSGFCGVVCYVKNEVVPIAYGINGNRSYDWRAILNKTIPPVFPKKEGKTDSAIAAVADKTAVYSVFDEENEAPRYETNEKLEKNPPLLAATLPPPLPEDEKIGKYDDEEIARENYYEVKEDERVQLTKTDENAPTQSANTAKGEEIGFDASADVDVKSVRKTLAKDPDGYYLSIKREIDELFSTYPRDDTLCGAFRRSEWVRIRGSAKAPKYLVGTLYEDGKARFLCYALAAENKAEPPEEIKGVCSFVPVSPLVGAEGFFVIFQNAATGECVKPPRA